MKASFYLLAGMTAMTRLLHADQPASAAKSKTEQVAFAQYCFWTGEMQLGQIEGVIRTEAGFFQGREVTLVDYDPARISLASLAAKARAAGVADRVYLPAQAQQGDKIAGVPVGAPLDRTYRAAPTSDQKKQLEGTPYSKLKLSPEQATKANAFARVDQAKARQCLGPEQQAALARSR